MAYMNTPRAYAAAVQKYAPGTEKRKVAEMRAVLAAEAARAAHEDGDYARASRALEGLHRLGRFGDVDPGELTRRISSTIARRSLSSDAEALARGESLSTRITLVAAILGGVIQILAGLTNDRGIQRAAAWIDLIVRGRVNQAQFTEQELRDMASMCVVWSGGLRDTVVALTGIALAGVQAWAVDPSRSAADRTEADRVTAAIREFVDWTVFAFDTICSEFRTVFPRETSVNFCGPGGAGVNRAGGRATSAEDCCPPLVYNAARGNCVEARVEPEPAAAARRRFIGAWRARRDVEVLLWAKDCPSLPPLVAAQVESARARDASTAAELCAAGTALLAFQSPLPRMPVGSGDVEARAAAVTLVSPCTYEGGLRFIQKMLVPPQTHPYCYIAIPPAGGCPAGCQPPVGGPSGGGGGAQSGGGAVAVALPAVALLWYLMR